MLLRHHPAFVRFWLASTVSDFGTYITTVALSVLILVTLGGTALDQGLTSAARWAPYLLFGLLAGVLIDKFPRRKVLIAGDLGRGLVLAAVCGATLAGTLGLPGLTALMFVFGALALASDAAQQSLLPQLVPRSLLTRANARLQQSDTVAQTTGGAVAGGLVALVTAPLALLLDALSYFFSAATLVSLGRRSADRKPVPGELRLHRSVAEGLGWLYGRGPLGPLARSTHIWFIGSAILGTVLPSLVINDLGLGPLGLGLVMGCAGLGAVTGTLLSTRAGSRWGTGPTMIAARLAQPAAVALVALAPLAAGPLGAGGTHASPAQWPAGLWGAFLLAGAGQLLFGMAMGIEGPLEMGYCQAVTPDRMLARMSGTMRSVNRGMIVVGAPLGGLVAAAAGTAAALWAAVGFLLLAALALLFSNFRSARTEDHQLPDEDALIP